MLQFFLKVIYLSFEIMPYSAAAYYTKEFIHSREIRLYRTLLENQQFAINKRSHLNVLCFTGVAKLNRSHPIFLSLNSRGVDLKACPSNYPQLA